MAEAGSGNDTRKFAELFEVIRDYAYRDEFDYQDKALQALAGVYVFQFEAEDMPDARPVVDHILEQYDHVVTTVERGNLDPLVVEVIVKVARYKEEYMEWGLDRLGKILLGLFRRSRVDDTYADYVEDANRVIRGLQELIADSVLEKVVEEVSEELGASGTP